MRKNPALSCLLFILFFSIGCAARYKPVSIVSPLPDSADCLALFPDSPWEAIHRIDAEWGHGNSYSLLGLTRGDPALRSIHSALLTPEGFVLFEAEQRENQLSVIKALPPFHSPDFARELIEDVKCIFLAPEGPPSESGKAPDGSLVCRWMGDRGPIVEIVKRSGERWKLSILNDRGGIDREIRFTRGAGQNLPSYVELHASGPKGYTLKMFLLQASP